MAAKPTDDALVLAALLNGRQWLLADEIQHTLGRIGFDVSTQQVAAWLRRLLAEDAAMFGSREVWGYREYCVTRYGHTQIRNHFDGADFLLAQAPDAA